MLKDMFTTRFSSMFKSISKEATRDTNAIDVKLYICVDAFL
jgi:hypothetical protein